ncbi:MAG: HAMP domain-containing histidine kinase [Candidatus Midichloria mitochondrii]
MTINNENQGKDINQLKNSIKHNWQIQLSPISVTLIPSFESLSNEGANVDYLAADYSDIVKYKSELQELTGRLKQVELINKNLIQNIVYNLKIPCNTIFALVAVLHELEDDVQKRNYIASIVDYTQSLLSYYDKLSKNLHSSTGLPLIELKKFHLESLVNKIIDKARPVAKDKGINLSYNFQYQITNAVVSDSHRIESILEQLIDNGIRFTNKGTVVVTVNMFAMSPALSESEQHKREMVLQFIVHDTGIGLSRELQEYLRKEFDEFDTQCEEMVSGLKFVKRLIDELHGEIEVTSMKGKISTIICNLPVKLPLLDDFIYDNIG